MEWYDIVNNFIFVTIYYCVVVFVEVVVCGRALSSIIYHSIIYHCMILRLVFVRLRPGVVDNGDGIYPVSILQTL